MRDAGVEGTLNHPENWLNEFHRAAVEPSHWGHALDRIAQAFDSDGATLVLGATHIDSIAFSSSVAPLIPQYMSGQVFDPREQRVRPGIADGFMPDHAYFSPREISLDPYYQEFLRPNGMGWNATAALQPGLMISVKRAFDRGPYEGEVLSRLNATLPSLRAASRMAERYWHSRFEGQLQAFDTLNRGALLLDKRAQVIKANASFRFGQGIDLVRGFLRAERLDARAPLQNFLRRLVGGQGPSAASFDLPRASRPQPLLLDGIADDDALRSLHSGAVAVLLVSDLDRPLHAPAERLQRLFGLTATECALADALAGGHSLREAASQVSITEGHARKRLQTIYAKTGASRQGELIALIAKLSLT